MLDAEAEVHAYRKRAVAWLEYACAYDPRPGSKRYLEITEGRVGGSYSACGDLAHWMLFRLGVRLSWINRDEHLGWKCGENISRLVRHSTPYSGSKLEGGDIIVVANDWPRGYDAHVVCIVDQPTLTMLATAEYGLPGGKLQTRELPMRRQICVVLSLAAVLKSAGLLAG